MVESARGSVLVPLEASRRRYRLVPFNVAIALPAQLTVLGVVLVPTMIVVWLSLTDWQPTQGIPWYEAEPVWLWNYYDLFYDARFVAAVLRTLLVVVVCMAVEFVLAMGLASSVP
jgi:multiple sugar transport system permease protein